MVSRRNKTLASLSLFLAVWAWNVSAAAVKGETAAVDLSSLTAPQIEEQLQVLIDPVSRVQYYTRANRC
jgi:zinc transporter 7